jgi:hypothetical protein
MTDRTRGRVGGGTGGAPRLDGWPARGLVRGLPGGLVLMLGLACADVRRTWDRFRGGEEAVQLPALLNEDLPFRYPPDLYMLQVQDNVTLRLHIDSLGMVVPESTMIAEHAASAAFDAAALAGAAHLIFRPARRGERRIGYTVLFPIKFRVPGAPPLPGDSASTRQ